MKAILFDIDGVFIKTAERFSDAYAAKHKVRPEIIQEFFNTEFEDCLIGKSDLKKVLPKYFESWKWKGNMSSLLFYWFSLPAVFNPEIVGFNKEVREKGIKTYAATNQEIYRATFMKENLKLGEHFDEFFASAEIGFKKPDPKFWETILERINLNPEEIVFVDDDEKNVLAASEIGISSILYRGFDEFKTRINELL